MKSRLEKVCKIFTRTLYTPWCSFYVNCFSQVLDVRVQPTNELRRILLRDDWCHADVRIGE